MTKEIKNFSNNQTELTEGELQRYSRQLVMPEVGREGQEKLKRARVLVVGAGGLGSPVLLYLAAAGVGMIGIADGDGVELSNLGRQIVHNSHRLGVNKAESARRSLLELNPDIQVKVYPAFLTSDNIEDVIRDYDFMIDGMDNFDGKFLLNDACVRNRKPFCHAGVIRFQGQVMTWVPGQGACYRCVFGDVPGEEVPHCSELGVMGAAAGVIGSVQALEAIKYITGAGELLTGKMFIFDGLTMSARIARFGKSSPNCPVCGKQIR